jgi:hypothetical protein
MIMTSFGMYNTKGMNKHGLEGLPILCVSESGNVGYTVAMRLGIQLCLQQMTTAFNPPIDYPLGLFTNRDVIIIAEGLYKVMLMHHNAKAAMRAIGDETNEFSASKIVYTGTTTDKVNINNFGRLEAAAKQLLTPEPTTPPKIDSDWQNDFLEPIFKLAREKIRETKQ